jgi:hypothetical protein
VVAINSGDHSLHGANGAAILARINRITKSFVGNAQNFTSVRRKGLGGNLSVHQLGGELAALGAGNALLVFVSLYGVTNFCSIGDRPPG